MLDHCIGSPRCNTILTTPPPPQQQQRKGNSAASLDHHLLQALYSLGSLPYFDMSPEAEVTPITPGSGFGYAGQKMEGFADRMPTSPTSQPVRRGPAGCGSTKLAAQPRILDDFI